MLKIMGKNFWNWKLVGVKCGKLFPDSSNIDISILKEILHELKTCFSTGIYWSLNDNLPWVQCFLKVVFYLCTYYVVLYSWLLCHIISKYGKY